MKTLQVKDLRPGMMFSKPVYVDGENILVPENVPLKAKDLERLMKWKIDSVKTEGTVIEDDAGQEGDGSGENVYKALLDSGQNKVLYKLYVKSVQIMQEVFEEIHAGKHGTPEKMDGVLNNLFPAVRDNPSDMIGFTLRSSRKKHDLAESSINCAIISIVIGLNLKLPSHKAMNLGMAALLHDSGMFKIPEEILQKTENLSEAELNQIKTHTLHSLKIITKELKYPEEIGIAALQHHERWDGKGYPHKIAGKKIHLYARIISVADAFEAMISERPYRNSMIAYSAMRQILNDNSRRFDSDILKVFIKSMGIYPIGSSVLLNNTGIGKVIQTHPDAPLRPEIMLLVGPDGKKVETETRIDLLLEKNIFIAKAIHHKEFQEKVK